MNLYLQAESKKQINAFRDLEISNVTCVFSFGLLMNQMTISPVLLFDVGEDLHALRADLLAVSQQVPGAGIQETLVGHVREDEALGPDEVQTCDVMTLRLTNGRSGVATAGVWCVNDLHLKPEPRPPPAG